MNKLLKRSIVSSAVSLLLAGAAQAAIFDYGFTVSGPWFDNSGNPYGMPLSPSLTGTVRVDNSLTGFAAVQDFSFQTGSKTWTMAEVVSGDSFFDVFFNLVQFDVQFQDSSGQGYFYSNNTVSVQEYLTNSSNACNSCVQLGQGVAVNPVPEPETYAMMLAGLGLLGLIGRRRKQVAGT